MVRQADELDRGTMTESDNITPPLDEFLEAYDRDDNEWWRLSSGDHMNLFDEAIDRVDTLQRELRRLKTALPVEAQDMDELLRLLDAAGSAADWGFQMSSHFKDAPGGQHFWPRYSAYHIARVKYFATRRPLNHSDYSGCAGCMGPVGDDGKHVWNVRDDCSYHLAAKLQPWNHRISWACGNYWDGCNCEGGPFYDAPEGTFA